MRKWMLGLIAVVAIFALRVGAEQKKPPEVPPVAPAPVLEPIPFTPEQITRLSQQRNAVVTAEQALALQREKWDGLLKQIALEQRLDLATHDLNIVELPGDRFAFSVKKQPEKPPAPPDAKK